MTFVTARTCRKRRRCECGAWIVCGDRYLMHRIPPDYGDVGNVGWWEAYECATCATRNNRSRLLNGAA